MRHHHPLKSTYCSYLRYLWRHMPDLVDSERGLGQLHDCKEVRPVRNHHYNRQEVLYSARLPLR
jgi:hypothetical protein